MTSFPDLFITNSLHRQKEKFIPLRKGFVSMYVCGPTVYGHSHIGHAKSYISFDIMVKWFKHIGYQVKYVQNITDVGHLANNSEDGDDPIIREAKKEQLEPMEIAQFFTRSFNEDMAMLGVAPPNIAPTAAGHIPEQIELIKTLISKGNAYEVNGSVYFDVSSFDGYGKLSGRRNQESMESGTRVEVKTEKRHPSDFALWKKADPSHIMQWNSPWGWGFPGWHIECSAMSMKYLGETIDIHGGGLENQFPHHECEIAQSEAATQKPFARYWVHNNMVTVNGQKMGKSLGNFTTIKDALKNYNPLVIRFFILQSHYRSTLDFSDEALNAAKTGLEKLSETYNRLLSSPTGNATFDLHDYELKIYESMNDDFNTPQALAVLFDLSKDVNSRLSKDGFLDEEKVNLISFFNTYAIEILGVITNAVTVQTTGETLSKVMELVIDIRKEVRNKKDFAASDLIRDKLKEAGIEVKDSKEGTIWRVI